MRLAKAARPGIAPISLRGFLFAPKAGTRVVYTKRRAATPATAKAPVANAATASRCPATAPDAATAPECPVQAPEQRERAGG